MQSMVRYEDAAHQIADECYARRVTAAARSLSKLYDGALSSAGILVSQLKVLAAIAHFSEKGAPLSAIAKILDMDPTTMTRNLQPLEVAGLVRVARSPGDARVRFVFLTRGGERKIEEMFPLWERAQKTVRARLGEKRANELRKLLRTLVDALRDLEALGQ